MSRRKRSKISAPLASEQLEERHCDHTDCRAVGLYPAPRSRENLDDYYWFCLDHVRAYNRGWNYYTGMTEREVESMVRSDTVWQRPSWPLGSLFTHRFNARNRIDDSFGFFEAEGKTRDINPSGPETEKAKAFRVLELTPPTTVEKIKTRYKSLVKRHHPDTHGGDKASEDRLKEINLAYQTLMNAHYS